MAINTKQSPMLHRGELGGRPHRVLGWVGVPSTACRGLGRGRASQTFCFKDEVPVGQGCVEQNDSHPELP